MDDISEVSFEPCINSKFVQPYRVRFKQDGKKRFWDCTRLHDSVAILIFNKTRKKFVLVKQFRPAVYVSRQENVLEELGILATSLNMKESSESEKESESTSSPLGSKGATKLGPGSLGFTYELCAGVVDKRLPLNCIAQEEILEETGYKVPLESLEQITMFYSSVGHGGSKQTMYYCEVTDSMSQEGAGGGNKAEGELIEVVNIPMEEAEAMALDSSRVRTSGLSLALLWFVLYKKHLYQ